MVDPVNILWFGHAQDGPWLREFRRRADGEGVGFGVMMCDQLGQIGSSLKEDRDNAVENVKPWLEASAVLGCSYLRVNPYGNGNYLEQCKQCSESLRRLGEISRQYGLEILVENHGHPGSNGAWLAMLVEMVAHERVGIFADFDNFFMGGWNLKPERRYDRLQGMLDLAPYARALSAKAHAFDAYGRETTIDFERCLRAVLDAGFRGVASAEYEGGALSGMKGSELTIALLRSAEKSLIDKGYH